MAQFSIPKIAGQPLQFEFNTGEILFVLGANGTGKSSLMQRLNREHHQNTRWISAHRQSWFASDSINLSPHDKRQVEQSIRQHDVQLDARWKDHNAAARANIAIYELVEAENSDARAIAKAARAENEQLVKELAQKDAPIDVINELLKSSNLPIELSLHQDEQVMAAKSGSTPFSIARLSDGERNALLIAANVLTAKSGTLILIDEPERHLHRSIISPLLTQLFKKRKDCAFIVSTHDVLLPLDNPNARTLLIRACSYNGGDVAAWDADLVPSEAEVDEVLKADILGSRKRILFVEGTGTGRSLDQPFYSLVFPEVSVIAKANCRDVEQAVTGVRSAVNLHWLKAFGIVDSDGQQTPEIEQLKQRGVYAVPAYSVEALYYHPDIQRRVAERHAAVTGKNAQTLLADAKNSAIAALNQHADRMSRKVAEKAIRARVIQQIPNKAAIEAGQPVTIQIDIAAEVSAERTRFNAQLAANNLDALIQRYPVRETPGLSKIAEALGFQGREQYESAVLKLLMDDPAAVTFVRSLFGTLWSDITAP
jgi:ABC-type cobalamin/Fe3+-siderophores transport system ATPase subunit